MDDLEIKDACAVVLSSIDISRFGFLFITPVTANPYFTHLREKIRCK
jgi:hypothetical protein